MSCKEVLHHVICNIVSLERDRPAHWKSAWRDRLDSELRALSRPHPNTPASLESFLGYRCPFVPRLGSAVGDGSARILPPPGYARREAGFRRLRTVLVGHTARGRGVWHCPGHHPSIRGTVGSKTAPIRRDRAGFWVSTVDSRTNAPAGNWSYPAW